jgi:DNA invertase Pin-like site-specific DNA recombinase
METVRMIPAAQYLRMSTEHQQYSLENQSTAIGEFARKNGFVIVRIYSDAGKSGLLLKERIALQGLLSDVVSGTAEYKAILVYDVSRWGRFQDADEAAHYEFLCRQNGVAVHYCAEPFTGSRSFPNALMKALKRVMASEYSRELSAKVREGSRRVSASGFRTGGEPGYALRRMLASGSREPKFELKRRERKSLQSDRVILVPGPESEVACVKNIYRMFVQDGKWPTAIAAELREKGVPYVGHKRKEWYPEAVSRILKNPKYCGCSVFGQSSFILRSRRSHYPQNQWTVTKRAWEGIVDQLMFDRAQAIFKSQTIHKADSELLADLRALLNEQGKLSERLVNQSRNLPSVRPFTRRFGSLSEAFQEIGYVSPKLSATHTRRRLRKLKCQIVSDVIKTDPARIGLFQPDGHFRPRFEVFGLQVSLHLCRCLKRSNGKIYWLLQTTRAEQSCIGLVVRLNPANDGVMDMFVVPDTRGQFSFQLSPNDPWLDRGRRLFAIGDFLATVKCIDHRRSAFL